MTMGSHRRPFWIPANHVQKKDKFLSIFTEAVIQDYTVGKYVPTGLRTRLCTKSLITQALSLRSRRQHKAWGVSPRIRWAKPAGARETGDSVESTGCHPLSRALLITEFNLGLAPQALCCRLLRRLSDFLCKAHGPQACTKNGGKTRRIQDENPAIYINSGYCESIR